MNPQKEQEPRKISRRDLLARSVPVLLGLGLVVLVGCDEELGSEPTPTPQTESPKLNSEFAKSLQGLINDQRQGLDLQPLQIHVKLTTEAIANAFFLAKVNFPDAPPGTTSPSLEQRIREAGYQLSRGTPIGEAIVRVDVQITAEEVLGELLANDQTRKDLSSPKLKYFGASCVSSRSTTWCSIYYTGETRS